MDRNWVLAALTGAVLMASFTAQAAETPPSKPPLSYILPNLACGGLHAIPATHTFPPYPPLSRKLNEQGRVVVMVTMDTQGVPTDVSLNQSSGFDRLDEAATAWVKQTWRWAPLDASCPNGARTLVAVEFKLVEDTPPLISLTIDVPDADFPPGAKDRNETGVASVILALDDKGDVLRTRLTRSTAFNDLDIKALVLAQKHKFQPANIDGKPVASMLGIVVQFGPVPPPPPAP